MSTIGAAVGAAIGLGRRRAAPAPRNVGRRVRHAHFLLPVARRPGRVAAARSSARNDATTTSETMPTRSARRRRQAASRGPRSDAARPSARGGSARAGGTSRGTSSAAAAHLSYHPRIDELVHHVGQQVDDHREHRDVHRHRLDHREVAAVRPRGSPRGRGRGSRRRPRSGTSRRSTPGSARPTLVRIGIIALRSTCFNITRLLGHALGARGAHVVLVDLVEEEGAVEARSAARGRRTPRAGSAAARR